MYQPKLLRYESLVLVLQVTNKPTETQPVTDDSQSELEFSTDVVASTSTLPAKTERQSAGSHERLSTADIKPEEPSIRNACDELDDLLGGPKLEINTEKKSPVRRYIVRYICSCLQAK